MIGKYVIYQSVYTKVDFVGTVMSGKRKLDIIVSKKLNVSLCLDTFSKSKLKSPEINIFLFSVDNLSLICFR